MADSAARAATTEVLAGLVERVTFHNAENGFCVLRVEARGRRELITVWSGTRRRSRPANSSSSAAAG